MSEVKFVWKFNKSDLLVEGELIPIFHKGNANSQVGLESFRIP